MDSTITAVSIFKIQYYEQIMWGQLDSNQLSRV